VQYLYLHRIEHREAQTVQYVYRFEDHRLSPNNLVIRKLFHCMLEVMRDGLTAVEIEYNDAEMAKLVGLERAVEFLTVMGAREASPREYRRDGVLLSRTFTTELTPARLDYFFGLKDLDIAYRLLFLANGAERIHMYFSETLSCLLPIEAEDAFLELLSAQRVPHRILWENR